MPMIQFQCASCGRSLRCAEGGGEQFRCPGCGTVGTVPGPADPPPERPRPRVNSEEKVRQGLAVRGRYARWRGVARGVRTVYTSLLLLIGLAVVLTVIGVGMVLLFGGFGRGQAQFGPEAAAFAFIAGLLLAFLGVLLDLVAIVGQGLCISAPRGSGKGQAIVSLAFALLSLGAGIGTGIYLATLANKPRPSPSELNLAGMFALATSALGFLRWATFVAFLRVVAEALGANALERNAWRLLAAGTVLFAAGLAVAGSPLVAGRTGRPLDPAIAALVPILLTALGLVGLVLVIWYMVVLRQTSTAITADVERYRAETATVE